VRSPENWGAELPLVEECHPPAQEARLRTLGLAYGPRPLINRKSGACVLPDPRLGLGLSGHGTAFQI
jgi:hypothetical protein